MGAGQSDLYKGTYGDNIRNIPYEARPDYQVEKIGYLREESNYGSKSPIENLTRAQKTAIKTLENTVRDHLKESDFTGARADLEGTPILDKNGDPFQHETEMRDSYKGLKRIANRLRGSLNNPNLGEAERNYLQDKLSETLSYLDRIKRLFDEFGGI